jgi:hypothetical protein
LGSIDVSIVTSVFTTLIFTAPPDATVTATVDVEQFLTEAVSLTQLTTQTLIGIVTRTIAPIGMITFELINI